MNTNILASNGTEIKTDNLNEYGRRALQTRKRRQAAGKYKRPTKVQKAAFAKAMQSRRLYGDPVFSVEELQALATHPHLHPRQRAEFAAKAEAQGE